MARVSYMPDVNYMKPVSFMSDVRPMSNVSGLQDVTPLNNAGKTKQYKPRLYVFKDTKPIEKANSLLDVILSKQQRDVLLEEQGLGGLPEIPLISPVIGTVALLDDKYVDPIKAYARGEQDLGQTAKEIGLNTLTELSETPDILSNIVKSQFESAGGEPGFDSLVSALGLDGERKVYNFDTGNTALDIFYEIIADPITWVTLGAGIVETGSKAMIKSGTEVAIDQTAKNLSKQATKDLAKAVTKTVVKEGSEATFENVLKNVNRRSLKEITEKSIVKTGSELLQDVARSKGYKVYRAANLLKEGVEGAERAYLKGMFYMTPLGIPAKYGSRALKSTANHIYNSIIKNLKEYDLSKDFVSKTSVFKEFVEDAMLKNQAINESIFKNNKTLLEKIGLNEISIQEHFYRMAKNFENKYKKDFLESITADNKDLTKEFINYLQNNVPSFKAAYADNKFVRESIEDGTFQQLTDVVSIAPAEILRAERLLSKEYKQASLNTMRKYIQDNQGKLENVYKYVDEQFLVHNGKHYGLDKLDNYLADLLTDANVDRAYKERVADFLHSVGINRKNASGVSKIIKSQIKDKDTAIKKLLNKTVSDSNVLDFKSYNKMITKNNNRIKKETGSALNKIWKEDIPNYSVTKYKEIMESSITNIEDAVNRIQNNVDVQRSINYIRNNIRLQDLPELKNYTEHAENYVRVIYDEQNKKAIKKEALAVEKFLKKTDRIISKLDKDPSLAFDIPNWYNTLDETLKSLERVQVLIKNNPSPYSVKLSRDLQKIHEVLEVFTKQNIEDDLANYVDNVKGMVQGQLSHQGMFTVINQHVNLTSDEALKPILDQLANKDSVYRQKIIPDLVEAFNTADMPDMAARLNKVVGQIDTVTNLNVLLSTDLALPFKLSNRTQQTLRNILFDTIENHKSYTIVDILSDETTRQGYKDWKAGMQPKHYKDILLDSLDYSIENTRTVLDLIQHDVPDLNKKYVMSEIKTCMHNMLDNYIYEQSKIGKYVENVSLSTLYDRDTIEMLDLTLKTRYDLARNTKVSVELLNEFDTVSRDFYKLSQAIQLGIDDIQKINKKLAIPLDSYEATKMLRRLGQQYNLYSGSVESGMFAAKYMIERSYKYRDKITGELKEHIGFEEMFKLTPEAIQGSNEEFLMLSDKLWAYRDLLHEEYKYEKDYIERLREVLTQTYSRKNALFAPKNPRAYFNSLGEEQLLAWEVVTKSNLSMNNKANFALNLRLHRQKEAFERYSVSDYIAKYEEAFRNTGFSDENVIGHLSSIARTSNAVEYANRVIDANLMTTLHSLDDLGKHSDDVVEFLRKDVADQDYITRTIVDIQNQNAIKQDFGIYGNPDDLKKLAGVSYGYEEVLDVNDFMQYAERSSNMALNIANMDIEELATHIYRQTDGALIFHNSKITKTLHADGSVTWDALPEVFNFTKEELQEHGLKMQKITDEHGDWYFIRLTDNRIHNKIPKYSFNTVSHKDVQKRYTDLIDKYRWRLNMWEEDVPSDLIKVETINEDTWNNMIKEHIDFFGDLEEQKLYQKLTPQGHSMFFNKSFSRVNFSVIGGADTFNLWNMKYSKDFIPRSQQMSRNTLAGLTAIVNRTNKIKKYLSLFFNNDYSLDNPLFTKMFSEANSSEIKKFFEQGKYKVALLRADTQGMPKVHEYYVTSKRSLNNAIKEGGILVPRETFNAMKNIVNSRKMTNNLLDVYRRIVPSTYKSMYLFTAGFPFRNAFDTLIYKNANELGGITAIPSVFKYEREASKALELHNKIQQEVFSITGGETYNKDVLLEVLSKHTKDEAEVFFLTDLFINSDASGGFSRSLSTWLEDYNKNHTDDIRKFWERVYEDDILYAHTKTYPWTPNIKAHPLNPLARMRDLNDHIEQTGRMALFLASVDSGLPINDSILRVIKTHFDYNSRSSLMEICERLFWFSTFPINNFNYYVNGGLTKSPTMFKLLMDTQTASWNNGEYTYEELKKTNFLAYHALTGNIRINNTIIKLSPSVFDFINLVTDPVGNVKDRLNPIISVATGQEELKELNPAITQFRNYAKFKEGNPIPSILARINQYDWDRPMWKWRTYYRRSYPRRTWIRYPKIRRAKAYATYMRKYYSRRYRTNVRRLTRTSLYHDAVRYYRTSRKGATYRDL